MTIHRKGCASIGRGNNPELCDCGAAYDANEQEPFDLLTEDDMRAMRDAYEGTPRRRGR